MFDNQSKDLTVHIIINGNIEYFHAKIRNKAKVTLLMSSTQHCAVKAIYTRVPYMWNNMKRCLIS